MTRPLLARLRARLWRGAREEDGSITIPFVIMFPIFFLIVISSIEMGILTVRHVMLERGLDMSVRGLRLGTWVNPTHADLKRSICRNAGIIPDCMNSLLVELRPVNKNTWQPLNGNATCIDRSAPVQPVTIFNPGVSDEMMLIRACIKVSPMAPLTGLGMQLNKDAFGQYALVSATAFVNEPRLGGGG